MSDKSNAENMRKYRARKKEKLIKEIMETEKVNEEEANKIATNRIRKKNSEDRQKLRMKNKGAVYVKKEEEEEKVDTKPSSSRSFPVKDDEKLYNKLNEVEKKLADRIKKKMKTNPTMRSVVQYIQKVKQVYKKKGKTFVGNNIGMLLNKRQTLESIRDYKNPKDHLWAIVNVLSVFPNTTEIRNFYSSIMGSYLKRNKKQIRENVKTQKQKENWLNKNKVIELYKQNKDKLNKRDKMLMQLIIYFPRRLQDYYKMKLHKTGKKDQNFNYLNVNRFGIPSSFQFFRSKSQGYEDTTKRIPSSIKNSLMTYIREMKNNTLLFPKQNGEMHSADSFSKHIKKLFKIITDKDITMNTFRHIFATDLSDKNYSMNYRQAKAEDMGQNLIRQMEYVKR